jgi:hypothetical protein
MHRTSLNVRGRRHRRAKVCRATIGTSTWEPRCLASPILRSRRTLVKLRKPRTARFLRSARQPHRRHANRKTTVHHRVARSADLDHRPPPPHASTDRARSARSLSCRSGFGQARKNRAESVLTRNGARDILRVPHQTRQTRMSAPTTNSAALRECHRRGVAASKSAWRGPQQGPSLAALRPARTWRCSRECRINPRISPGGF